MGKRKYDSDGEVTSEVDIKKVKKEKASQMNLEEEPEIQVIEENGASESPRKSKKDKKDKQSGQVEKEENGKNDVSRDKNTSRSSKRDYYDKKHREEPIVPRTLEQRIRLIKALMKDSKLKGYLFLETENKHHVINYADIGRIYDALAVIQTRKVSKYSEHRKGIIMAFGKIELKGDQKINSMHPSLHVDYTVEYLVFRANKNSNIKVKVDYVNGYLANGTFSNIPVIVQGNEETLFAVGSEVTAQFKFYETEGAFAALKCKV